MKRIGVMLGVSILIISISACSSPSVTSEDTWVNLSGERKSVRGMYRLYILTQNMKNS